MKNLHLTTSKKYKIGTWKPEIGLRFGIFDSKIDFWKSKIDFSNSSRILLQDLKIWNQRCRKLLKLHFRFKIPIFAQIFLRPKSWFCTRWKISKLSAHINTAKTAPTPKSTATWVGQNFIFVSSFLAKISHQNHDFWSICVSKIDEFVFKGTPEKNEKLKALIAPSVLASDFSALGDESAKVLKFGADWLHLDVMDGNFVPNISFGFPVIKSLSKRLPDAYKDTHLMVAKPEQWVRQN